MKTIIRLFVVCAIAAVPSIAAGQAPRVVPEQNPVAPGGRPAQPGGGGPLPGLGNGDMTPNEIQRLFDAYLVMEVQQALDLSDSQYPQFLARLKTLQDTRRRNLQERNQLMAQLQRLSNPRQQQSRVDETAIKEGLASLQELEARSAAEMRRAYTGIDEMLNVVQQARFRVFEEAIERRKIELLMRARQQNRPRPQMQ